MYCFSVCVAAFVIFASCVSSENVNLLDNNINTFASNDMASQILGQLMSISERLNSFEQRLDQLTVKVDTLTSKSGHNTNQVLQDLRAVCEELSAVKDGATKVPTQTPTTSAPAVPFRVTRVEKTETVDHYRVKVMYEGSVQPMTMISMGYGVPFSPLADQGELGMVGFNVSKDPRSDTLFLSFLLPEHMSRAFLNLNNTPNAIDIPRSSLEITQGSDITFKPGQKPTADFVFTIDGDMNLISHEDMTLYIMIMSDTEDNVVNRYMQNSHEAPADLSPIKIDGQMGNRYGRVMLNSTNDVDCIVMVDYGVKFNCSGGCLVRSYTDGLMVRVYREDHDGPFPNGFIGFVHEEFRSFSTEFVCQIGEPICAIYCEGIGSDISSIEITKVTPTGIYKQTESFVYIQGIWGSAVHYISNLTFEDAGDFMCTVRSDTKEISELLSLVVIKRATIDRDASNVTMFDNGSALVTCLAEGIPTPNVTFVEEIDPEYDIQESHPTEAQTKVEMFIPNYKDISYYSSFSCEAQNVQNDKYGQYSDWHMLPEFKASNGSLPFTHSDSYY